nr:hypothetical protein [Candidatus Njordarchaeota archaeon]
MPRKRTINVTTLLVVVLFIVALNLIVAFSYPDWFILILPLSTSFAVPTCIQILSNLGNMPELEIRHISNKSHRLYELYHHKDVPLRADTQSGERSNNLLIGVANAGNSTARNCYAILWIYGSSDFSKPLDNPFPLYWSYDPNSITSDVQPPQSYSIAPGDEKFLEICYTIKKTGKFYFNDYGKRVSARRPKMTDEIIFSKKPKLLYIKVIAYCDNGESTQKSFRIIKKNYESLTMEEIPVS